jgi:hypothetical protein
MFSDIVSTEAVYTPWGHVNSVLGLKIYARELLQNDRSNEANTVRKSRICGEEYEMQRINDFN